MRKVDRLALEIDMIARAQQEISNDGDRYGPLARQHPRYDRLIHCQENLRNILAARAETFGVGCAAPVWFIALAMASIYTPRGMNEDLRFIISLVAAFAFGGGTYLIARKHRATILIDRYREWLTPPR